MKAFSLSFLLFSCSSLIVLGIVNYAVPIRTIVQIIALLLMVALIILHLFDHAFARKEVRWFLLFLMSFIVQLLVASTGGLPSPFFILFHLTALGVGLLINSTTALLFLASSALVLVGRILLDNWVLGSNGTVIEHVR